MADTAPQSWSQLIQELQQRGEQKTISRLFAHSAEENGNQFEGLEGAISDALRDLGYDSSTTKAIYQDAPFLVNESRSRKSPEERQEKHGDTNTYGGGGTLLDHNKYEQNILDTLGEQQQEDALTELNSNHDVLTEEQTTKAYEEEARRSGKTVATLTEADKQNADAMYKRKLQFKKILERNGTIDGSLQEQHDLLAKQLEDAQVGGKITLDDGTQTTSAAQRVRLRAKDLRDARETERKEFSEFDQGAMAQLQQKKNLSKSERKLLERYQYLRGVNERERRGGIRNIDGWTERFSRLSKTDQDALMRKLLARQQNRSHGDAWDIFETEVEKKNFFTGKMEKRKQKVLTRAERRRLLTYQKVNLRLRRNPQKINPLHKVTFNTLDRFSQDDDSETKSLANRIQDAYFKSETLRKWIDRFSKFRDWWDNFRSGGEEFDGGEDFEDLGDLGGDGLEDLGDIGGELGEAAEGAEAATGAAGAGTTAGAGGAAVASAPLWPLIIILIIVGAFILIVVVWFIFNPPVTPPYAPPLPDGYSLVGCGDKAAGSVNNTDAMQQFFYNKFGLGTSPNKSKIYSVLAPFYQDGTYADDIGFQQESRMYNITCILFGSIIGNPYSLKQNEYNTFGDGIVGSAHVRESESDMLKRTLHDFQLDTVVNYTDNGIQGLEDPTPCAIVYEKQTTLQPTNNKNMLYQWRFHNPQQCGDPKEPNPNYRDGKFNFLTAQYLGHMFILQEEHAKTSDVFQKFKDANLPATVGPLPTDSCLSGKDYGENAQDQQMRNCFADMVGLYISYPFYYDAPGGTSPTATSSGSPLLDFPYGKFRDYYQFAKQYLFGGHDLVIPPDVAASCPSVPTDKETALALLQGWGFTVTTEDGLQLTTPVARNVYQVICLDYQSAKFRQLVNADRSIKGSSPIHIIFSNSACSGAGFTSLPNIYLCMRVKGDSTAIDPNYDHLQYYLTHELGHVIQDRNSSIYTSWLKAFNASLPPYLYTLNCNGHQGPQAHLNQINECLADAIALYTTYGNFTDGSFGGFAANPLSTYTTYNTKSDWQTYYQFVNQQIFNGTDFFSTSGSGTGNTIADYATQLAKDIIHYCPSVDATRTTTNVHSPACLQSSAFPTYPLKVIDQLVADIIPLSTHSQPSLQCVGFSRAVVLGKNNPLPPAPGGVASGYAGKAIHVWTSSSNPNDYTGISITNYTWYSEKTLMRSGQGVLPGDVAIFANPDGFNHIAIVTKPLKSSGPSDFYVAEASGAFGLVDVNDIIYHFDNHFAGVYRLK